MKRIFHKLMDLVSSGREINFAREKILAEYLKPLAANRPTLEIGCCVGETNVGQEAGFYTGADLRLDFLEEFRKSPEGGQAVLVQADATCLPFATGSYGFIYSTGTLELIEHQKVKTALQECARVGSKDSIFLFQLFNSNSLQYEFTKHKKWRGESCYSYYPLTLCESRKMLADLGYTIVKEFHFAFLPYFIVNKSRRRWIACLDFILSSMLPQFAGKNVFICRYN